MNKIFIFVIGVIGLILTAMLAQVIMFLFDWLVYNTFITWDYILIAMGLLSVLIGMRLLGYMR